MDGRPGGRAVICACSPMFCRGPRCDCAYSTWFVCHCLDTDQSRLTPALSAQQLSAPMAPHLTLSELDFVHDQEKNGKTPIQIHAMLMRKRDTAGRQDGRPGGRAVVCAFSPKCCRDPRNRVGTIVGTVVGTPMNSRMDHNIHSKKFSEGNLLNKICGFHV